MSKKNFLIPVQGAHAGLLLIKPAKNVPPQALGTQAEQASGKQVQTLQPAYSDPPQSAAAGSNYALQNFGARIGENADSNSKVNENERTFSLLFGSKKPTPLRPHPVTRALPPQVSSYSLECHLHKKIYHTDFQHKSFAGHCSSICPTSCPTGLGRTSSSTDCSCCLGPSWEIHNVS